MLGSVGLVLGMANTSVLAGGLAAMPTAACSKFGSNESVRKVRKTINSILSMFDRRINK